MDDKRIEDILRDSCRPDLPHGMRDRVLRAARQELARHPKRSIAPFLRPKPLLATGALLILLLTNIADQRLQSRLETMTDGLPAHNMTTPVLPGILRQHQEMATLLVQIPGGTAEGDESL